MDSWVPIAKYSASLCHPTPTVPPPCAFTTCPSLARPLLLPSSTLSPRTFFVPLRLPSSFYLLYILAYLGFGVTKIYERVGDGVDREGEEVVMSHTLSVGAEMESGRKEEAKCSER